MTDAEFNAKWARRHALSAIAGTFTAACVSYAAVEVGLSVGHLKESLVCSGVACLLWVIVGLGVVLWRRHRRALVGNDGKGAPARG